MDDAELMARLRQVRQQGSRVALNALLEGVRPEVVVYLRDRVDSHPSSDAVAEELTQQTLLRVASSIGTCRAQSAAQFRSWVTTIARRLAMDRHRRREGELEQRAWEEVGELERRLVRNTFPRAPDERTINRSSDVLDRVLGRILMEAQKELSPGTRRVVKRRLLLEETWAQVGEAVGTSEGGAKRRWQRAIPRLRREVLQRIGELPLPLQVRLIRRIR